MECATMCPLVLSFDPVLRAEAVVIVGLAIHRAFQILPAHGVNEASSIQQKTTVIRVR